MSSAQAAGQSMGSAELSGSEGSRELPHPQPQPLPAHTHSAPRDGISVPVGASMPLPSPIPAGRPAAVGAGTPAPVRVGAASQIPGYNPALTTVLTAPNGSFEVSDEDRRVLVALDIDGRIVVVWTARSEDARVFTSLKARLARTAIAIAAEYEADRSLIATLYEPSMGYQREGTIGGKSAIDDEIDKLCLQAHKSRASDIHLAVEPLSKTRVEVRIDGDIVFSFEQSGRWGDEICRALFTRGDEDTKNVTFNPRVPQGLTVSRRIREKGRADPIDLRLRYQSAPAYPMGYDVVLRVLHTGMDALQADVAELGFSAAHVRGINDALDQPTGLTALIGATGSGKSTTIKSMVDYLDELHQGARKIRTIEDPPEYRLRARQHPVVIPEDGAGTDQERAGAAFLKALRAAMRQDPDTIVIGEIRDPASAELAMQATLTGHQVLTTFHASNLIGCIQRFRGLGMPLDVLGGEGFLQAIISQRLIKVLCPNCSIPYQASRTPGGLSDSRWSGLRQRMERCVDTTHVRFRGPGCEACNGGLKGRSVVAETLVPDWRMLELITAGNFNALGHYWRVGRLISPQLVNVAAGFSMREHVIAKIQDGKLCPIDAERDTGPIGRNLGEESLRISLEALRKGGVIDEGEFKTALQRAQEQPFYPGIGPGSVSA